MTTRTLANVIEAIPTSDGAGVKLRRSLGQSAAARLDPFLMLDHFSTENPDDYIAGFPAPRVFVHPYYDQFWKPWPRAYSWNYIFDERQSRLAAALGKTKIRFFDLREDLAGIPGTYRKLDGHWSQKGEAIVADRVQKELKTLLAR